ncbi:hypothetical protein GTO89_10290 [Heliobacterium gestii]|uniref:Uncharacterized protein n=1 Tax=Heliomicrobium gestii TaxID=2699 RepID=A0A845LB62_HELGE|nr:hypothetical protein [Heliomicrobium gestii]MBM7867159.1 hypothetical protein [Heliomicrobium gestii]MZP43428.1 hypothetical protein [Heliomicrobium gestii]
MIFTEKQLEFDFSRALSVEKLDQPGRILPEGMMFVDFVVETEDAFLLIDVKDPSHTKASTQDRLNFVTKLTSKTLVTKELVPKCRDSYTYLHLMNKDHKTIIYIVLICVEHLNFDPRLLPVVTSKMAARLKKEGHEPWKRTYISSCQILDFQRWNQVMPYPVRRIVA